MVPVKRLLSYPMLFSLCFFLDRITKHVVLQAMQEGMVNICYGFNLVESWNYGISFGMAQATSLQAYMLLCFILVMVIISLMSYTGYRLYHSKPVFGEMMVLAGALSNMVDRYEHGAVFDFIDLYIGAWHWYTFNIADACIVIGMFIMILIHMKEEYNA